MKQLLIRRGQPVVEEVPAPRPDAGSLLVRVGYSCISTGTEASGIRSSALPLWKRALKNPEKLRKLANVIASEGIGKARALVQSKLDAGAPAGYSAAGVVLEAGAGSESFESGDRVACAGAQCAHHAEVIRVPRNLAVAVPAAVSLAAASTVALGAIALQGVRRANPTLGETFVVLGLGLLGQLTVQLLKANGCQVIGSDLDPRRLELARRFGLDAALTPGDGAGVADVLRRTDGHGADGVLITAATPSDAVIATAFQLCRRKGRVVLVGDVGLNLNRADFYEKELDFFISTSYGPGRYDASYEEAGLDYPIGHVRWTENRNMAEYLRLLAAGKVQVEPLVSATFPIDQAPQAYAALRQDGGARPLMMLLEYPQRDDAAAARVALHHARPKGLDGRVRLGIIGAGSFTQSMHLPNLRALADRYHIRAVVNHTGHRALAAARQAGADYAATDTAMVLRDPAVDAVLIATRHDLHAPLALAALQAGKAVLVEKPLALTTAELAALEAFFADRQDPVLLTGFNRRFSPCARRLKELLAKRTGPVMLNYRMNAGYLPPSHWVHGATGGGRNRGEACHIYDLFTFLIEQPVARVSVESLAPATAYYRADDNFVATFRFADGSVASLSYTALGSNDFPKERLEAFADGQVYVLDDYHSLQATGGAAPMRLRHADKGHREELVAFASAVRHGGAWPIPLWQQVQATTMAFEVERGLGGSC